MSGYNTDGGRPLLATERAVAELQRAVRKLKNVFGFNGVVVQNSSESISIGLARAQLDQPGGSGGGIGFKVCKVTAVNSDHYECRNIDAAGAVIGDPFEVWPVVYEGGITATYDLTIESGDGMVHPKLRIGSRVRVCTGSQAESIIDGTPAEPRIYTFDPFYVACVA